MSQVDFKSVKFWQTPKAIFEKNPTPKPKLKPKDLNVNIHSYDFPFNLHLV